MISVTETASKKIKSLLENNNSLMGIRLSIKKTGCSGLMYSLDYINEINPLDIKISTNNVEIYIESKSAVYLNGVMIDYVKKGLNENFEFINPNEKNRCGCGISFTV